MAETRQLERRNGHSVILGPDGERIRRPRRRRGRRGGRGIDAYYDAGGTSRLNSRHWAGATNVDANAALSGDVTTIRQRARYELANSGYGTGVVNTYADDMVGRSGPTLQVIVETKGSAGADFAGKVESAWREWCEQCDASSDDSLCDVLRMQLKWWFWAGDFASQIVDGDLDGPVRMQLLPIAPERIATPLGQIGQENLIEGVQQAADGKPVKFYILKLHPGSNQGWGNPYEFSTVDAADMRLVFERIEPGQARGEPKLAPVLEKFAQLRQYCQDTVTAARVAAIMACFLETELPASELNADGLEDEFDVFDIEPASMTMLPAGRRLATLKPNQPTTTHNEFKRSELAEVGRAIDMPLLRVGMDAGNHNFSSARLDLNAYWGGLRTKQGFLERGYLKWVFGRWFVEYRLATGINVPPGWRIQWGWDPPPPVEPVKEAIAQQKRIDSGVSCLRDECSAVGKDWEELIEQRGAERKAMIKAGLISENEKEPQRTQRAQR